MSQDPSLDTDSDVFDPSKEPDRGHPMDRPSSPLSVLTRSQRRALQQQGLDNSNNKNSPSVQHNESDIDVLDSDVDTEALTAMMAAISTDPDVEDPPAPITAVINKDSDSDIVITGTNSEEFRSIFLALQKQVPGFDWNHTFEGFIWRNVEVSEVNRIIKSKNPEWSIQDFIDYKQCRAAIISDISEEVRDYLERCGGKQLISRARKAFKLIIRVKKVLERYACDPAPEDPKKLKIYIDLYNNAIDLFERFAEQPSGCAGMTIREVVTQFSKKEFSSMYPPGFLLWQRLLQEQKAINKPKPAPITTQKRSNKRNRRSRVQFDSSILPPLPTTVPILPIFTKDKPSFDSIIDSLNNPIQSMAERVKLQQQLREIQQAVDKNEKEKGYLTAKAAKAALDEEDSKLEVISGPPPTKRRRLESRVSRVKEINESAEVHV